ncbi:hypothetical protein D3C79_878520 [compost metagenome]
MSRAVASKTKWLSSRSATTSAQAAMVSQRNGLARIALRTRLNDNTRPMTRIICTSTSMYQ